MLRRTLLSLAVLAALFFNVNANASSYSTSDSAVGGVMINADGMLSQATAEDMTQLRKEINEGLLPVSKNLNKPVESRKVSLKLLNEFIAKCEAEGKDLPDSVLYLGGLTAIEYVLIYPEENDVVLVGPAEGWEVGPQGVMVGKTTGRPVMLLDDLATAIKAATGEVRTVFSVSIDPTQEGLRRMSQFAASVNPSAAPQAIAKGMEESLGPQTITLRGVDPASHFAYVMAAADFRMKQISMGVTKSPVRSIPSFVSMMKAPSQNGALPRWWLAPNYDSVSCDADRLTWSFSGGKVVTMTDMDFFDGNQIVRKAAKKSSVFQQWADKMTENYDELAKVEPIFGQLRNCMDCALVAAIVAENDLMSKMGSAFVPMTTSKEVCAVRQNVPQHVASTAVTARRGGSFMFVTGGVSINPWETVQKAANKDLADIRKSMNAPTKKWYAN